MTGFRALGLFVESGSGADKEIGYKQLSLEISSVTEYAGIFHLFL